MELKVVYLMFRSCACQNQMNESMWCFCAERKLVYLEIILKIL